MRIVRVRVCAARRALVAGRKQALLVQVHESVLLLIRGRASVVVVGGVNTQVLAEWVHGFTRVRDAVRAF